MCVVKDNRITKEAHPVNIYFSKVKEYSDFGSTVDFRWKGKDGSTNIIDRLEGNMSLKQAMMKIGGCDDLRITAGEGEWEISTSYSWYCSHHKKWIMRTKDDHVIPSKEEWVVFRDIAKELLNVKI